MTKATIKITYKKSIIADCQTDFEQKIFDVTYDEFVHKVGIYDPKHAAAKWSEIKRQNEHAASMNNKLAFAIEHFIDELENEMPDVTDNMGVGIYFSDTHIDLIESDLQNKNKHRVSVYFTSERLKLHDAIGSYMILSYADRPQKPITETFVIKLTDDLSVSEYLADEPAKTQPTPLSAGISFRN